MVAFNPVRHRGHGDAEQYTFSYFAASIIASTNASFPPFVAFFARFSYRRTS
jgi:hypothetical protein